MIRHILVCPLSVDLHFALPIWNLSILDACILISEKGATSVIEPRGQVHNSLILVSPWD